MPNWCWNDVMIYGPAEDRDKFLSDVKAIGGTDVGDAFEFSESVLGHFFPLPVDATKEIKTDDGKTYTVFSDTGYNAAVRTWGTKWPDSNTRITEFPDSLNWKFDSPWGPPVEGIAKLSELYPTLYFADAWEEEQGIFAGFVVRGGNFAGEVEGYDWNGGPQYPEDDSDNDILDAYYQERSLWEGTCRDEIEADCLLIVVEDNEGMFMPTGLKVNTYCQNSNESVTLLTKGGEHERPSEIALVEGGI
jgi:hypothetical protein